MFVIDMRKGFYISFFVNIGLAILLLIMTILYFTKGMPSKEENLGLQQLSISGYEINFDSEKYAYYVRVDQNVDSLDIGHVTYEKSAEVKIEGNEALKEGNNQIVITVTEDAKDDKVYYIIVEKIAIDSTEEINENETDNEETIDESSDNFEEEISLDEEIVESVTQE